MTESLLNDIKIVLVGTTHPGNIGATARVMKTMGLSSLVLVNPKIYPDAEATARASGADDILANAQLQDSLADAIADCHLVFGTSTRRRSIPWPLYTPSNAATKVRESLQQGSGVAFVFGRESSGLANEELELCNAMIQIPANPGFSSLNIASAVQIISYEIRMNLLSGEIEENFDDGETNRVAPASHEQIQQLFEQLEHCLVETGYLDPGTPRRLMRRLKRIINRSELDAEEYNMVRGIIESVRQNLSRKNEEG